MLVVQEGTCKLYEMWDAHKTKKGWDAGSGAVFSLRNYELRPEGWTSADAAGLPIFPLLARYPEVATGQIDHALRVTVPRTQRGYIHPATHFASTSSDPELPPMGLRLRLKASYSLAGFTRESLVILEALKRYGLIVADNGSPWFITGAPSPHWNDENLEQLKQFQAPHSKLSKADRSCTTDKARLATVAGRGLRLWRRWAPRRARRPGPVPPVRVAAWWPGPVAPGPVRLGAGPAPAAAVHPAGASASTPGSRR